MFGIETLKEIPRRIAEHYSPSDPLGSKFLSEDFWYIAAYALPPRIPAAIEAISTISKDLNLEDPRDINKFYTRAEFYAQGGALDDSLRNIIDNQADASYVDPQSVTSLPTPREILTISNNNS